MKRKIRKNGTLQKSASQPINQWTAMYPLPVLSQLLRRLVETVLRKKSEASIEDSWKQDDSEQTCFPCNADQLPRWHFKHRRVCGGYRCCRSLSKAFWSLFTWHNESINIWSHYIGTMIILIRAWFIISDISRSSAVSHWFLTTLAMCLVFGNATPFLSSAICHHFYGINQTWHRCCWFMDFTGLMTGVLGITTGYLLLVHQCQPMVFLALFAATFAAYLYFVRACYSCYDPRLRQPELVPCDRFPEFSSNMTKFSIFTFFIAFSSTIYYYPQYLADVKLRGIIYRLMLHPVLLATTIVFFAQGGFPERLTPYLGLREGFFDYVGHSHQLWHFASWGILYIWLDVVTDHYQLRANTSCPFI